MTQQFYVDDTGKFLGGFDGAEPPAGAIEVPTIPPHGNDTWDFDNQSWISTGPTPAEQILTLEAQQTPRRIRDALLGNQESIDFLQDIEDQIAALRDREMLEQ